jgi:hypothetical protein
MCCPLQERESETNVTEETGVGAADGATGPDGIVGPVSGARVPRFAGS